MSGTVTKRTAIEKVLASEWTQAEAARQLGCSRQNICSAIRRAWRDDERKEALRRAGVSLYEAHCSHDPSRIKLARDILDAEVLKVARVWRWRD